MPDIEQSGGRSSNYANVNDTANATFDVIAAAANKITRLHRLLINLETDDTITVKFGNTTIIGPLYLSAKGGLVLDLEKYRLKTGTNEAVKITKGTAATKVTAFAQYNQD